MKLNIPSILSNKKLPTTPITASSTTIDNEGNVYLTPNSSLIVSDQNSEEFRTPLNETPNKMFLSPSRTADTDDSGLDEVFSTPKIPKMKSLEDLNILDMEFQQATKTNLHPGKMKTYDNANCSKMKSLSNLVFDIKNEQELELRQEFERLKNQSSLFKQPAPPPLPSNVNGKFNRNKIGITKFIGNDDPEPKYHYPITKMKSLGTIPDVVTERIHYDPFLTPMTGRKNSLIVGCEDTDTIDIPKSQRIFRRESSPEIEGYNCKSGRHNISRYPEEIRAMKGQLERNFQRNSNERNSINTIRGNSIIYNPGDGGGGGGASNLRLRQSDGFIYYTDGRPRSISTNAQELMRNPSSGSLVISETGSLDRMKTAAEKRKKGTLDDAPTVSDRVEETRVNPDSLIDEILKDTKLDQLKETTEPSGLQLYIARDGTASLGSHRVKSHVSAGAIKQVVMDNPR